MLAPTEKILRRKIQFTQLVAWLALFFTTVGIAAGYVNWLRINSKATEALSHTQAIQLQLNNTPVSQNTVNKGPNAGEVRQNIGLNKALTSTAPKGQQALMQLQWLNQAHMSYLHSDEGFAAQQYIKQLSQGLYGAKASTEEQSLGSALTNLNQVLNATPVAAKIDELNVLTAQAMRDLLNQESATDKSSSDTENTSDDNASLSWLNRHIRVQRFKNLGQKQHIIEPVLTQLNVELNLLHQSGQRYNPNSLSRSLLNISQACKRLAKLSTSVQASQWQKLSKAHLTLQKQLLNIELQFKLTQQALMTAYNATTQGTK